MIQRFKVIAVLMMAVLLLGSQVVLAKDDVVKNAVGAAVEGGKIDLNTADLDTLVQIKGIGPKTAENIIAYRDSIGKFKSLDELLEVKGIGEKTLEAIRPFLMVK